MIGDLIEADTCGVCLLMPSTSSYMYITYVVVLVTLLYVQPNILHTGSWSYTVVCVYEFVYILYTLTWCVLASNNVI